MPAVSQSGYIVDLSRSEPSEKQDGTVRLFGGKSKPSRPVDVIPSENSLENGLRRELPPATWAGRPAEKIVILHADRRLSGDEVQVLVDHVKAELKIDFTGVLVQQMAYDVSPDYITNRFAMAVIANMEQDGRLTDGALGRAWFSEVAVNDNPRVVIVVYK